MNGTHINFSPFPVLHILTFSIGHRCTIGRSKCVKVCRLVLLKCFSSPTPNKQQLLLIACAQCQPVWPTLTHTFIPCYYTCRLRSQKESCMAFDRTNVNIGPYSPHHKVLHSNESQATSFCTSRGKILALSL